MRSIGFGIDGPNERRGRAMAIDRARLNPRIRDQDHTAGPADAPVTLVEYGDYECPYCGRAFPILKQVQARLEGRLRFVYRHFPLREMHPHAEAAAEAAEAAAAQASFWLMHERLYLHQRELDGAGLLRHAAAIGADPERVERELSAHVYEPRVRQDVSSGERSGVNGTPTFFINGVRYDGLWDAPERLIDALLEAGVPND
jgi:protein-disulfide isomerase